MFTVYQGEPLSEIMKKLFEKYPKKFKITDHPIHYSPGSNELNL